MRTLLILRHAKSSWDEPGLVDHDRPLNARGKRDAVRMGRLVRERDLVPDAILCSTALRARKTVERVVEASRYEGRVRHLASLYQTGPAGVLRLVRALPARCRRVLVVGHNPVLEDFVEWISGTHERLPTAALAVIEIDGDDWSALAPGTGHLAAVWRPKELDD